MDGALKEQTREIYDVVAASYARAVPDTSYEAAPDLALVQHMVSELGDRQPARVLDAGCGAGRMMTYLRSLDSSLDVTGVDLSPLMVEEARAISPSADIREGDIEALPFDTDQFDAVLAWYSIIHTRPADLPPIFVEFHRVLRPDGMLLVAFQAGAGERVIRQAYGHEVELRAFLHRTPDVVRALGETGFAPHSQLERTARASERHDQAFILSRYR